MCDLARMISVLHYCVGVKQAVKQVVLRPEHCGLRVERRGSCVCMNPEYRDLSIPADTNSQRQLLRGLMNLRAPQHADADFLKIQDTYLQGENAAKGITDVADLTPIQPGLYLWQGDITTLQCDAIVNAANSGMTGCYIPNHRCIDNAIHTFAGVELRLACAELMEQQGYPEPTGRAKITPAFNLPCRYVLHTVGPIIDGRPKQTKSCWLPATAPAWRWQRKTTWKAWRSAAFPQGSFIFPMTWRHKSPWKPSRNFSKSKPV